MKIISAMNGQEIPTACFQFDHKGYTVSVSNMFGRYEILVFKGDQDFPNIPSIDQAITFIESLLEQPQ